MKKRGRLWLGAAFMAAALPLTVSSAFAAHQNVDLKDANGTLLKFTANPQNTPYSPKQTCTISCHANMYGTGTKTVYKTQAVLDTDAGSTSLYWQTYTVTAYEHGAVIGRHSQDGRNEDYSLAMKTAFQDEFFTSSPGMFGKY